MKKQSDNNLIAKYLKGDEKSLEILISKYLNQVFSFVFKYVKNQDDASDITQEVFIKVWKNLKKIDNKKSFKSWLFTVAKNTAIDFLRKKKIIPFSAFGGENMITEIFPSSTSLANEILGKIDFSNLIAKLPKKYRLILSLRYNSQLAFNEIAESLDESINTIKTRHRRALLKLRKFLD